MPADRCSTGEQKALLVGLVLAHARLVARDHRRRADRCCSTRSPRISIRAAAPRCSTALEALGAQVWMTGADPAAFAEIAGRAAIYEVTPGRITPVG